MALAAGDVLYVADSEAHRSACSLVPEWRRAFQPCEFFAALKAAPRKYHRVMNESRSPMLTSTFAPILAAGSPWAQTPPGGRASAASRMSMSSSWGVCRDPRGVRTLRGRDRSRAAEGLAGAGLCTGGLPIVGVSWTDAVDYCAWRSVQDGRVVRLPTEAEWEFAARGRQEALFPWGDVMPG